MEEGANVRGTCPAARRKNKAQALTCSSVVISVCSGGVISSAAVSVSVFALCKLVYPTLEDTLYDDGLRSTTAAAFGMPAAAVVQ